jgi:flagellar assembly protein FliH
MLSKVLNRRDAANLQAMVFPLVNGVADHADSWSREEESGAGRGGENVADLRESLHQLQVSAVAERREAAEAGRRQGDQEARAELVPVMERLNAAIAEIVGMRSDLRRRAERDVVQLALLIARRVLHRQLNVDDSALTAIARVAFERLTRSESYTVTVHPRFASSVASALSTVQASRVQIKPDPECAPGTLTIRSAEGVIDASVDAQLDEISRGLADRLASS